MTDKLKLLFEIHGTNNLYLKDNNVFFYNFYFKRYIKIIKIIVFLYTVFDKSHLNSGFPLFLWSSLEIDGFSLFCQNSTFLVLASYV